MSDTPPTSGPVPAAAPCSHKRQTANTPAIEPVKSKRRRRPRRLPRPFPLAEVVAMLRAARADRDRLMIQLGVYCGLRVSEIVGLEVPDLDFDAGALLVREGKGGKDRVVPLPAKLGRQLQAWLAGRQTGYVFPSPRTGGRLTTRAFQRLIKRIAGRAGLPEAERARKAHPHRLRHSFASWLIDAGTNLLDVAAMLGHESVTTTQIYAAVSAKRMKAASEALAEAFPMPEIAGPPPPLESGGESEHKEAHS